MLNRKIPPILEQARKDGWVLEPDAKRLLKLAGIPVPKFETASTIMEAVDAAERIGYPVVAKVVSPAIVHKSEVDGVVVGIDNVRQLQASFKRFDAFEGFQGMLVEEMLPGKELIVGAKIDDQFGPVLLMGIGGTGVEIYRDSTIRMAPINEKDVRSMLDGLRGSKLLMGYRGSDPIDMDALISLMLSFSDLVTALENEVASIDLNPVKCTPQDCIVADARIMLSKAP